MKSRTLLFFLLACIVTSSQEVKTIIPKGAIAAGTAFQVQYVVTGASSVSVQNNTSFPSFQLVSGPNIYKGKAIVDTQSKTVNNIVYTLVPLTAGKHEISGIHITADGRKIEANTIVITVVQPPTANFHVKSSYTDASLYAPSSRADLDAIIKENLFVIAEVDKTTCYEGEAVIATFKLYSRLQTTSEVVKMPGFYGFTSVDIVKNHQSVETIGGRIFNTSILRKVQLYPVHSGKQMVDPMQVNNLIEFKDSLNDARKIEVEKTIITPAININVKPLPQQKPKNYDGAVGIFKIGARLEKQKIASDEQGKLFVTISGKGNFVQFPAPQIEWPNGLDVFTMPSKETITRNKVPLEGTKTYVYSFSVENSKAGKIPPIEFSFFNTDKKEFETVRTDTLYFEIADVAVKSIKTKKKNSPGSLWLVWVAIGLATITFAGWLLFRKREPNAITPIAEKRDYTSELEALPVIELTDRQMAEQVQKVFCDFLKEKHGTTQLDAIRALITEEHFMELKIFIKHCQQIVYTNGATTLEKDALKKQAAYLIKALT